MLKSNRLNRDLPWLRGRMAGRACYAYAAGAARGGAESWASATAALQPSVYGLQVIREGNPFYVYVYVYVYMHVYIHIHIYIYIYIFIHNMLY